MKNFSNSSKIYILLIFFLAVFLYIIGGKYIRSYDFDIWVIQSWGYTAIYEGLFSIYTKNIGGAGLANYPPLSVFLIAAESLLSLSWDIFICKNNFPLTSLSPTFKFIHKFTLGIFHMLFSFFLYSKVFDKVKASNKTKLIALSIFLFNPVSLLVGTVWGQIDELLIVAIFICLYYLHKNNLFLSSVFFSLSLLIKVQSIIFLPVFVVCIIYKIYSKSLKVNALFLKEAVCKVFMCLFAVVLIFTGISLPFIIYNFENFYRQLTNLNIFPYVHMGGFNTWMLIFGDRIPVRDDYPVLASLSYYDISRTVFVFISANLLIVFMFKFLKKQKINFYKMLNLTALLFATFFMFMTEIHERFIAYYYLLYLLSFIFKYIKRNVTKHDWLILLSTSIISTSNLIYILYKSELKIILGEVLLDQVVKTLSAFLFVVYTAQIFQFSKDFYFLKKPQQSKLSSNS